MRIRALAMVGILPTLAAAARDASRLAGRRAVDRTAGIRAKFAETRRIRSGGPMILGAPSRPGRRQPERPYLEAGPLSTENSSPQWASISFSRPIRSRASISRRISR